MGSRQKATKSLILRHKLEEKEALCYISLHLLKSYNISVWITPSRLIYSFT